MLWLTSPFIHPLMVNNAGFTGYPEEKTRIEKKYTTSGKSEIIVQALFRAGFDEDSSLYANITGETRLYRMMKYLFVSTLENMTYYTQPFDNDLLLGAYFASGRTLFLKQMLNNISNFKKDVVRDSIRFSVMRLKYGTDLGPKERESRIMTTLCIKYKCKKEFIEIYEILTISNAFVEITKLAELNWQAYRTMNQYLESDPVVKKIIDEEKAALLNYIHLVEMFDNDKKNKNIEKAILMYENFEREREAFEEILGNKMDGKNENK